MIRARKSPHQKIGRDNKFVDIQSNLESFHEQVKNQVLTGFIIDRPFELDDLSMRVIKNLTALR